MAVKISGVLKDGAGKPVQNCTIQLKAKRNSTTVVVNTVASENPDEAGRYSMDVEYGQYSVILLVEGFPPSHAGTITVYEDSQPGTLNDFLGAMTEDDARPEALRRFELMVEEVAHNASAVAQNTAAAKKSASDAGTSAREAASELASRVIITTATRTAGDPMNNCEFNGFVMPGGWTDIRTRLRLAHMDTPSPLTLLVTRKTPSKTSHLTIL